MDNYFKKFVKTKKAKEVNNEVWLYTRVSSRQQFESNNSISNQRNAAIELAYKKEYHVTREFGATYESAKDDFTRKEFENLIHEVKKSKRKPFALLIFKMSRFSRTGGHAIGLVTDLINVQGVHLIEVSTETDTTTPLGEARILDSLMHARRENIERLSITVPGMKAFVKNGNWLGKTPRGYDHHGPKVLKQEFISTKQSIKINEEGLLLKKAWEWKSKNMADHEIIRKLSLLGLKVKKQFISRMWRNPFYAGINRNTLLDGETILGNWEPMIDKDVFIKINDRFDQKPKNEYESMITNQTRPLQNHLYCDLCGGKMTGYKAKKKFDYYKCLNAKCKAKDINANSSPKSLNPGVHDLFVEFLEKFKLKDSLKLVFIEQLKLSIYAQNFENRDLKKRLEKEKISKQKNLEKLEERYALEGMKKEIFVKYSNQINDEINEISDKLMDAEIIISNLDSEVEKLVNFGSNIANLWHGGGF